MNKLKDLLKHFPDIWIAIQSPVNIEIKLIEGDLKWRASDIGSEHPFE